MLFYLTNTLIIDKKAPEFPAVRKAARYIAMAAIESKHLLRGDYDVLKYLEQEFKDDLELYPVFHQLVKYYATYTVPDDIYHYVEVVLSGYSEYETAFHKIKQIEYSYFDDSMKVQAMTVVTEDEDDCALLKYILRWYLKTNNLSFNFALISQGGGGSRTDNTVKSCLKDGKMVICITDSDQRYPAQPLDPRSNGAKCGKIKALKGIYYFLRLPVHEVENLVPLNHYDELNWEGKQNKSDKKAFDKLCYNAKSETILPFFDIKEGIKKEYIDSYGNDMLNFAAICCFCNPEIMKGMEFHKYVESVGHDELVYPRLRKRPMADLAPLYNKNMMPEPELMTFQLDAWVEIASLLLDATCARNKEAIMP